MFQYIVQPYDSIFSISQKFNIPINLLLSLNPQILYNRNISIGQKIFITNKQPINNIPIQAIEIESNANSIMDDIDTEDWDKAISKLSLIKKDFNELKPVLEAQLIPKDLINIINNAIITLEGEITSRNIHESKVQAFIIAEYFKDILDIFRQKSQDN